MADYIESQEDQSGSGEFDPTTGRRKWKLSGVTDSTPGGAKEMPEDPLTFWRSHHNLPGYDRQAEINSEQQAKIAEIREKAKFDAQNFEKRYTTRQKSQIAKINSAKSNWAQMFHRGEISKSDFIAGNRGMDFEILGIKPSDLPKLQPYDKGQGIGDSWRDNVSGATITRRADGGAHVLIRPDQTIEGKHADAKLKMDNDQLKEKLKHSTELMKIREKHMFETTTDLAGRKTIRLRGVEELDGIMRNLTGEKTARQSELPNQQNAPSAMVSNADQVGGSEGLIPTGTALQQQSPQAGPPIISTNEEWSKLPSGTMYIGPDGNKRIKQ